MNVDLIFQIAGIGIILAVINQLLSKAGRDDIALLVIIAGLISVMYIITQEIGDFFSSVKQIFGL